MGKTQLASAVFTVYARNDIADDSQPTVHGVVMGGRCDGGGRGRRDCRYRCVLVGMGNGWAWANGRFVCASRRGSLFVARLPASWFTRKGLRLCAARSPGYRVVSLDCLVVLTTSRSRRCRRNGFLHGGHDRRGSVCRLRCPEISMIWGAHSVASVVSCSGQTPGYSECRGC